MLFRRCPDNVSIAQDDLRSSDRAVKESISEGAALATGPCEAMLEELISQIPSIVYMRMESPNLGVKPVMQFMRPLYLPTAYCNVRQLHDHLWQQSMGECSFYQLVHRYIRFDEDRLLCFIELEDVVERADIDDLVALARRVSC